MSNTTPNFGSILDESPTEILRPKPIPVGTYLCTVRDYELSESRQKKTPLVRFILEPIQPLEDVDPDAFAEAGGCEGKTLRVDYWATPDAIYRLDEFHEHCLGDLATLGGTRADRNDLTKNTQVLAVVSHRVDDKDPTRIYTDVARTAPAT